MLTLTEETQAAAPGEFMKITVINGSPKGELSVTLKSVQWLELKFPRHRFEVFHVGARIKELQENAAARGKIYDAIAAGDAVLWAFPVYYMLVPAQLLRFIELARSERPEAFAGKAVFSLSTSVHFYDHSAHEFLRQVCAELGMRHGGFFSAETEDLLSPGERSRLESFFADFEWAMEKNIFQPVETVKPRLVLDSSKPLSVRPSSQRQKGRAAVITCG
ncbi:MAG TPA: NAD(P)H-dependent oxidoreductase, partial [Elusimicrobiales bacterium]|nr:NAD(P)H-dependent oxidoreductase [Elusimicrobiales bacterium]